MWILLAEDEPSYRDQISLYLSSLGNDVMTAASGRQAIDAGLAREPQLLVADWLLRDQIHGLHVAGVLQTVYQDLPVVVITGFGSADLKAKAREKDLRLLEKPFDLEELRTALESSEKRTPARQRLDLPMLRFDNSLVLTYRNLSANDLLLKTHPGSQATSLIDVFGSATADILNYASDDWVSAPVKADTSWKVRIRRDEEAQSWLIILPPDRQDFYQRHPIVKMLLETDEAAKSRWPFAGRVLVVDDEEIIRSFSSAMFEHVGCICHTAETHEQALQLFERDPGIEFVLLDYEMPGSNPAKLIQQLRAIRPEAIIVGNSGGDRRGAFADAGVSHFLAKPWRIEDLMNLLVAAGSERSSGRGPLAAVG